MIDIGPVPALVGAGLTALYVTGVIAYTRLEFNRINERRKNNGSAQRQTTHANSIKPVNDAGE